MMFKEKEVNQQITPMLEGLLLNDQATPPVEQNTEPPQTWEEADKQLADLMKRRAVAMDVLSKL